MVFLARLTLAVISAAIAYLVIIAPIMRLYAHVAAQLPIVP